MRCSLKWGNERNPCPVLQVSRETAPTFVLEPESGSRINVGEEGEDDVKSAWPFDALGDTHAAMADTKGCQAVRWS